MSRWSHFVANAGLWAAIRTVAVAGILAAVAVGMMSAEGAVAPAGAYVVGMALPFALREAIVDRVELAQRALRIAGYAIVVGGAAASLVRGRRFASGVVWEEGSAADAWALTALVLVVTAYLGTFFWLLSDARIRRESAAGD